MGSMAAARGTRRRRSLVEEQSIFFYRFLAQLMGWILRYWVRGFHVYHVERVPVGGGVFLICNHTTGMDPFLVGYPIRHLTPRGPGKIEIFVHPVVNWVMLRLGIFPIRQNMADKAAVRAMVELYRAGKVVIVFPEGERSRSGELLPFFPDFARLAIKLNATVVPAAIAGGKELMPMGQLIPNPNRVVTLVFGEEMDLSAYVGRKIDDRLAAEAAEAMQARVAELLVEARARRADLLAGGSGEPG